MTHHARATFPPSRLLLWCFGALLTLLVAAPAFARDVPTLVAHVNDTASMLTEGERAQLEQRLADYEQKTGHQFALLTIDSLDGDALESFSIRVVESWKLGRKGKDDGLLLLVVKNDHKLRTEVGYGLEGAVTDVFASRVNRTVLVPAMRAGQAGSGIDQALGLLMEKAAGENVALPEELAARNESSSPNGWFVLLLILCPILFIIVVAIKNSRGGGGGGWGGGGVWSDGGGSWGSGDSSSSSSGGDSGFSGGGGDFGGGGSSDSW